MMEVKPLAVQVNNNAYCSQTRTSLPPLRDIEQGVKFIASILAKEILCRHDVEDINQIYRAVDLLERQIDKIPDSNSHHALQRIIERVEKIACKETISTKELIVLYHLQNFSDKELQINERFKILSDNFDKRPEKTKEIATHLPYCFSTAQFNQDAISLIGSNPTEEVNKILNQKRKKLQDYEHLKEIIAHAKSHLDELRRKEPQTYPPYLDELLDNGYIHLYNHLLQMKALPSRNERRSEIEKITFSSLSHIVLETREAIIQKVKSSIPADRNNILFLLGGSGAGKSTTLCFLRGDEMVLKNFQYESQSDKSGLIGLAGATSCTFLPTTEIVNDLVIVDFPGFDDTNGPLISLGMECALKALIRKYNPKVLVLEAITNTEGKFVPAAQLGSRLNRLLENKKDCILGITKYSKDPDFVQIKAIEEQQKKEQSAPTQEEIKLTTQIETLSELKIPDLLSKIQEMERQLAKIQQEKVQKLQLPLPETDLKTESRRRIQERENELLKQIGLESIVHFYNLEDSSHLSSCLTTLSERSEKKSIRVSSQQILDPEDEKLLENRFKNDLMREIEAQRDYTGFEDIKAFERSVLESSLIKTIFSQSNPEIGQFLNLPEIDIKDIGTFKEFLERHHLIKLPSLTLPTSGEAVRTRTVPASDIGFASGTYVFATCENERCSTKYQVGEWIRYKHETGKSFDIEETYGPEGVKCSSCKGEFEKDAIADKLALCRYSYILEYGTREEYGGKTERIIIDIQRNEAKIFEWEYESLEFVTFEIKE